VSLETAVAEATGRAVRSLRRVGGGDINDAYAAELEDGGIAFVKTRADAPAGEYVTEAAGLRWLGEPGGLGVPEVLGASDEVLVLEWLEEGPAGDEAELGRGLARVHAAGADAFGAAAPAGHDSSAAAAMPLRIGPLVLPNRPLPDWPSFYAERRLRPLLAPARDRGSLSPEGVRAVERVCERMAELAGPPEPPARLHGDLWSGNVLWSRGRPYVIDPVAYGGHREVDLAMLRLFGSPGPRLRAAYEEVAPLAPGHEERVGLYQLFPLLVHAVLFGGGYGSSVERAAGRY
jgi:fructosamine-3-kinase